MKKVSLKLVATIAVAVLALNACKKDSATPTPPVNACSTVEAKFAANVLPLMQTSCSISTSCHAVGSSNSGGVLTTYAQISAKASSIKASVSSGTMPKTGTLSAAQKQIITCWVDGGALNN